jgi:hypothetical protein
MNTSSQIFARSVFVDSGLAPSARPGMTSELINRIAYYTPVSSFHSNRVSAP